MKKLNRVRKHQEFDTIIRGGEKVKSPHFSCYFQKSELPYTRIGLAVGKANGGAVDRVRIKRQVRAMIAKRNDYVDSCNIIIVIRPSFKESEFDANEAELNASLDRIKELLH